MICSDHVWVNYDVLSLNVFFPPLGVDLMPMNSFQPSKFLTMGSSSDKLHVFEDNNGLMISKFITAFVWEHYNTSLFHHSILENPFPHRDSKSSQRLKSQPLHRLPLSVM